MRAVHVSSYDGPSAVSVLDVPRPAPAPGQVLIRVEAAGVSFPELLQSRGEYQLRPPLPYIIGSEVAGTVVESLSERWASGDRVAAYVTVGGLAEYVAVDANLVLALPNDESPMFVKS